jgi:hypothetical protein
MLERSVTEASLSGVALAYDPAYDAGGRLRAYGLERGFRFSGPNRFYRTTNGFADLSDRFGLGVSFGEAVVNRHRIELYILDRAARIAAMTARRLWEVPDVLTTARSVVSM